MDGIIVVNKGEGITSQGVVSRVKRLFSVSKAGHTGTLDPLATGVLPVLVGRGVKASEFMLSSDKYYRAELTLGITTDTEDITGEVLTRSELPMPSEEEVLECIRSFVGNIRQTPPMYSALKVGGKKLCDLAREGITVEREPRDITVFSIDALRIDDKRYSLRVHCSKGTYIRTLCANIGAYLGCGAAMSALERTQSGDFLIENAHTIDELENMTEKEREALLLPPESLFEGAPCVRFSEFFTRIFKSGCEIYQKKINTNFPVGTYVRVYEGDEFLALAEVKEYEGGSAIKSKKFFKI